MKTKTVVAQPTENSKICRVFSTFDTDDANAKIAAGWVLLCGGIAHVDNFGYNSKPCFVLGKPKP